MARHWDRRLVRHTRFSTRDGDTAIYVERFGPAGALVSEDRDTEAYED